MVESIRNSVGLNREGKEETNRIKGPELMDILKIRNSDNSGKDLNPRDIPESDARDGQRKTSLSLGGTEIDEDLDDLYDAKEHNAKSEEALSQNTSVNEVIPPENFSHVVGEIYRSSFPRSENFFFLKERVKLRSVLVLIPEEYPQENLEFLERAQIQLFQIGMSGNKEPFVNIPNDLLTKALEIAINPANHPILIHCNRGKHRTGCLVGCIRKFQNWSLTMIFDEYRRFAFPKARALDQQFIEMYHNQELVEIAKKNMWLPIAW
ncbi:HDL229Cp [Eremothecium sinecaudum]|uniref:diphosphoinositol-polyphosphate diphosphatase n=1 Tax=Eremothecium sinecaudum TaxID=45286 RepID=A0A0X8HS81_9SACH|nr:HDL229Cp [Eremothecium sinecaudum]AMD20515.1 HDL229Cp [Eremothecium sinecaudum]